MKTGYKVVIHTDPGRSGSIMSLVSSAIVQAVKADRDHLVRITQTWNAGRFAPVVFGKVVPDYKDRRFEIKDRYLIIFKTPDDEKPEVDGASMFPDKFIVDLAPGYIPHDLGYESMEAMARTPEWVDAGWVLSEIRRMWDAVLGLTVQHSAEQLLPHKYRYKVVRWVASLLHGSVRLFGGIAHFVYKVVARVAIIVLVCSCAYGCSRLRIPDIFEPGDEPPGYTIESRLAGGTNNATIYSR